MSTEQMSVSNIEDPIQEQEESLIDKKKMIELIASVLILVAAALQGLGESMNAYVNSGMMTENVAKQSLMNEIKNRNLNVGKFIQSGGVGAVQRYSTLNQPVTNVPGTAETVDALFKIGSLTKDVAGATIGKIASESYNLAKSLLEVAITKLEESILGQQFVNLPEGTTAEKLNYISDLVNEIAQDPEARQAIINLSKSLANLGIQTLDATQPELDELTNKFWTVANGIANKSAVSAVTAVVSSILAVIADIPVIGGIIVDIFLAAKTFSTIANTASYSIEKSSEVFQKGVQTLGTAANVIADNATPIVQASQNAQQAVSNVLNKVSSYPQQIQQSMPGIPIYDSSEQSIPGIPIYGNKSGGAESLKNNKKIQKIKERIRRTVKKFKGEKEVKQTKRKSRKIK